VACPELVEGVSSASIGCGCAARQPSNVGIGGYGCVNRIPVRDALRRTKDETSSATDGRMTELHYFGDLVVRRRREL
jgi:hypothetical protein